MIMLLGDVHGDWDVVVRASDQAKRAGAAALVQVGDFGWSATIERLARAKPPTIPVYAIDGNHEDFGWLAERTRGWTTEVAPGLTFVGRGDVRTIAGIRIGFLGGAESVDKKWRRTRLQAPDIAGEFLWWPEERITAEQAARLRDAGRVDLLVTHSPPDTVIRRQFPPSGLRMFDIDPAAWIDVSACAVELVRAALGNPPLVCGHMRGHVTDDGVTILDINEAVLLKRDFVVRPDAA